MVGLGTSCSGIEHPDPLHLGKMKNELSFCGEFAIMEIPEILGIILLNSQGVIFYTKMKQNN